MRSGKLLFSFCFGLMVSFYANASVKCRLVGEIKGIKTEAIWLKKVSEGIRVVIENEKLRIPVRNGVFEYEFIADEIEAYEFVFDEELGSTRGLIFFPTEGLIKMLIHQSKNRTVLDTKGGEFNDQYDSFKVEISISFKKRETELMTMQRSLAERDELDSDAYKAKKNELKFVGDDYDKKAGIDQELAELEKTGNRYTEKGKQFMLSWDSLMSAKVQWKYDYVSKNQTLVSYFLIYDMARFAKANSFELGLVSRVFPLFAKKFPEHNYTKILKSRLAGLTFIKPGYKFIDFEAKTMDGKAIKISDVVKGKISLINLWGSWCGPCIDKSRKLVPIYRLYKDKGFTVVAVAREFKDLTALRVRLSKEQFNWLNLVELDDENKIWSIYGIGNTAGLFVLLDQAGTILAIDPKPEELEKILQEKL